MVGRSRFRVYVHRIRAQGAVASMGTLARDPRKIPFHVGRLLGLSTKESNFYGPDLSRNATARFVEVTTGATSDEVERLFREIEDDPLIEGMRASYAEGRPTRGKLQLGRFKALYSIVRITRPAVVVETGVHDGLSSSLILAALGRNEVGRLVSIDLPSTDLPPGIPRPGWLVPSDLRGRWDLHLGDARRLLPQLVENLSVGLFHHDSDHGRAHREFEFRTMYPSLAHEGILMSDETPPDDLGEVLAAEWGLAVARNHPIGQDAPDHLMAMFRPRG